MNIPVHTLNDGTTAREVVDATADPLELVVFNMADTSRPGGVVQLADEYGVQAFS